MVSLESSIWWRFVPTLLCVTSHTSRLCVCVLCVNQDVSWQWKLQPGLFLGVGALPPQPQLTQQPVLFQRGVRKLCSLEAEVHAWAVSSRVGAGAVCAWIFCENNTSYQNYKLHSLALKLIHFALSIKNVAWVFSEDALDLNWDFPAMVTVDC